MQVVKEGRAVHAAAAKQPQAMYDIVWQVEQANTASYGPAWGHACRAQWKVSHFCLAWAIMSSDRMCKG